MICPYDRVFDEILKNVAELDTEQPNMRCFGDPLKPAGIGSCYSLIHFLLV